MTSWAQTFTGLLFYAVLSYTKWEDSLWQLPIVSSVFKEKVICFEITPQIIGNKNFLD